MRVLFLGCHCDDIELGCGATIHKHKNDWDIHCCVLCSEGYQSSKLVGVADLSRTALESLGVENSYFNCITPDCFSNFRQEIWQYLIDIEHKLNPDIIVTQAADAHPDHVILNQETIRAFREVTVLSYLSDLRYHRFFTADTYESLDVGDVGAKLRSLAYYRRFYANKVYLDEINVIASLRFNGVCIKSEFAESYATIIRVGI